MCKACVDEGRMTQEQYEQALAAGDETVTPLVDRLADGSLGDTERSEVLDILSQLFGMREDQAAEDQRQLDSVADKILTFLQDNAPETKATPTETVAQAQDLAGKIMFKIAPSSIAVALAVIALRYRDLLSAWADLYVDAHGKDADPEGIDNLGETVGIPSDEMVEAVEAVRESRAEATQDLSDRTDPSGWSMADESRADRS